MHAGLFNLATSDGLKQTIRSAHRRFTKHAQRSWRALFVDVDDANCRGGCGQPGNLNWVFVTNSLVFRNRSSWHCLFDELFAPGDDFVQFNSDLSDFEQVVSFALNHEDEVQQIIACSTRKMKTVTLESIHDWMRATLRRCQFKQPNCLL